MKRINQNDSPQRILSTSIQSTTNEERAPLTDDAKRYNNEIFKRVINTCPAWKQAFSTEQAAKGMRREWLIGFSEAGGITSSHIEFALKKLREKGSPFMPSIGEFLGWCDLAKLPVGTKSAQDSYSEMLKYNCLPREKREPSTLSTETYHTFGVICESGNLSYFRNLQEAKALDYWKGRHDETLTRMKNGQPLKLAPAPVEKLEKIHQPASKSTAMSAIQAMKQGLKGL